MDPLGFLVNLFDVVLVFALALMIALVSNLKMADLLTSQDFTVVKNPGQANMEIITREGRKVSRYVAGDAPAGSRRGERVDTAYRLESGEIIYVPQALDPHKRSSVHEQGRRWQGRSVRAGQDDR